MVRLGLIGCGQLGRIHAECISRIEDATFVAYADRSAEAAGAALAAFGGEYATDDVERLLGDTSVDGVYICTRHDSHAGLAVAAAKANKHILIEKPLALGLDDCLEIERTVRNAGVQLMPAFKMRYYPLIQRAHDFITEPQVLVGQMMDARWDDALWAQDPILGGANVHSQGCHTTDVLRYLARSEPELMWAAGGAMTHPNHACIDQCVATIRFQSGCVASWIQGDAAPAALTSKFFIEVFGQGRSVTLSDRFTSATFFDGERTWTERRDDEEGFQLENQAFVDALQAGDETPISAADGIQATKMVLAADAAIRTGEVQRL